jgi:hypothetical protein
MDESLDQLLNFYLQIEPLQPVFVIVFKCKEFIFFGLERPHIPLLFFSFHPSLAVTSGLIESHILDVLAELITNWTRRFINFHCYIKLSEPFGNPDPLFKGLALRIEAHTLKIETLTDCSPIWSL